MTAWTVVSGSWRITTPRLRADLRTAIGTELASGRGIITGGALGVDYLATTLVINRYPDGSRIRVIIPAALAIYEAHYRQRAREDVITSEDCESLIRQLSLVQALGSLTEMTGTTLSRDTYYARNGEELRYASKLLAFQVDGSPGTQDTISKAIALGLHVDHYSYHAERETARIPAGHQRDGSRRPRP